MDIRDFVEEYLWWKRPEERDVNALALALVASPPTPCRSYLTLTPSSQTTSSATLDELRCSDLIKQYIDVVSRPEL